MDKKSMMKAITDKVGKEQGIDLVMQAYNTELLTTWIARIEANKPLGGQQRHDHLADAMERVIEVCKLAP